MDKISLQELLINFRDYLLKTGYSQETIKKSDGFYHLFLRYAIRKGQICFDLDFGKRYLKEHYGHEWDEHGTLSSRNNELQRQMRILDEFQRYEEICTLKRRQRVYHIMHFQNLLIEYRDYCDAIGLKSATVKSKTYVLKRLFEYWENQGITQTSKLKAENFYGFLEENNSNSVSSKQHIIYEVRDFIRFMVERGLCEEKLTKLFPVITVNGKNVYPSYFKKADVIKILQSVDTSYPVGKREYLILLLAAQLGMRTSDISSLKLQNVDFPNNRISFTASKTGKLQEFDLSPELFYAFADYIKNARRECEYDNLFTTDYGAIRPFKTNNFHRCLTKHIRKSGVSLPEGQKRGLHALRASLATNMLGDGVALPIISNVLDHTSLRTSKHYIKVDIEGLRRMALEVPS